MKRKIVYSILAVASILVMMLSSGAISVLADNKEQELPVVDTGVVGSEETATFIDGSVAPLFTSLDQFEKIASTDTKELYMLELKKQAVIFAFKDIKTGSVLYSTPANANGVKDGLTKRRLLSTAIFYYQDKKTVTQNCNTLDAIENGDYKIEKISGKGVRITYKYPDIKKGMGFEVPMTYQLSDDHFDVSVEFNKIKINKKCTSEFLTVAVMPYFGTAIYSKEDNGYMLIPNGSGALMKNNFASLDGQVKEYSTYVYGRDSALAANYKLGHEEATVLPVFGTKINDQAWFAVIDAGDAVSMIKARSARENSPFTACYAEFIYNKTDAFSTKNNYNIVNYQQVTYEPTDMDAVTVRYYGLDGDKADYIGMAETYREYLTEKGVGSDVSENLPFYIDTIGAFKKTESVMGFVTPVTKTATTFEQAESMIKSLQKKGIKNINLRYEGWMKGGIEGSVITGSKHESKLGSAQDLKDLDKLLKDQGGRIYLELEMVNIYKSKGLNTPNMFAVRNLLNNHAVQTSFYRSTGDKGYYKYYLCRPQMFEGQVKSFFKGFDKYGIDGVSAGSLGNRIYSNLNDTASKFTDSQQTAELMVSALASIKDNLGKSGSVMIDRGNSFALKSADVIVGLPMYSDGYEVSFTDVPFAQIALHGLVTYTETAHNLTFDTDIQLLRQFETGAAPYYTFTDSESSVFLNTRLNYIYTSQYKTWQDTAAEDYKKLSEALDGYHNKQITDHDIITADVRATTYGGERTILVNYSLNDYTIGSKTVPAEGYLVLSRTEYEGLTAKTETEGGEEQ